MTKCSRCRAQLPDRKATGRKRRFCSPACRYAAYRKRRARPSYFSSESNEWATPPALFARLDAQHGPFNLDAAGPV
jgi:hypothetical protein